MKNDQFVDTKTAGSAPSSQGIEAHGCYKPASLTLTEQTFSKAMCICVYKCFHYCFELTDKRVCPYSCLHTCMHVKAHRTVELAAMARVSHTCSQVKPLSVRLHGRPATLNNVSTSVSHAAGGYIVVWSLADSVFSF